MGDGDSIRKSTHCICSITIIRYGMMVICVVLKVFGHVLPEFVHYHSLTTPKYAHPYGCAYFGVVRL